MKLKTETIVAITTKINGKEVFIQGFSIKQDNNYIPIYSNDQNLAHDFETKENAIRSIDRIINYNNYRYDAITIEVVQDTKAYVRETSNPNPAA